MKDFKAPKSWTQITQAILNNSCIAVRDGSYDPDNKLVATCWVIKCTTSEDRANGASQTPGDIEDKDVYRAKLYRNYCVLICVK